MNARIGRVRRHGITVAACALSLVACAVCAGCSRAEEPEKARPAPAPQATSGAPAAPQAASPAPAKGEVRWDTPEAWSKADNPSPMRKATYRIPRVAPDTEDAELSVTQAGGSVEQNITRWAGQFDKKREDLKPETRDVGGLKVTVIEIHGPYAGMMMPGAPAHAAKPGFALLGAIVETSPPTFFKLTGPEKTVSAARRDFDKLVSSLRPN